MDRLLVISMFTFILSFMLLMTFFLFFFYVFFEGLPIPMYLLIGFWGSRERKIRAPYLLFFYTVYVTLGRGRSFKNTMYKVN